eukprot:543150-Pleurochrysis_carterae.AAC.1
MRLDKVVSQRLQLLLNAPPQTNPLQTRLAPRSIERMAEPQALAKIYNNNSANFNLIGKDS